MEGIGLNDAVLQEVELRDVIVTSEGIHTDYDEQDDQSIVLRRLLLRLKFFAFLMLAFSLFPLGVGTGTILYTVPSLPGYLLSALITGSMCLLQSVLVVLLVSEGWKLTTGSQTSCFFRGLIKVLIVTTLCSLLMIITYIAFSGIFGIVECSINSASVPLPFHRCGPHKNFLIFLSMTNLATGSVLLTLIIYMSNIIFRKFVKIGLTSVSKSGQIYIRLNHITSPTFVSDV